MMSSLLTPAPLQVLPLSEEALKSLEIVPLHPHMVTHDGFPDYTRRSPHPCLLFRIPKKHL